MSSTAIEDFNKRYEDVAKAFHGGFEELKKYYTKDCKIILSVAGGPKTEYIGEEGLREGIYNRFVEQSGDNVQMITVERANEIGDEGWALARIQMKEDPTKKVIGSFLAIWKKEGGKWKIFINSIHMG